MNSSICLVCGSRSCSHLARPTILTPSEQRIIRVILAQPGEPLKVMAAQLHMREQSVRTALHRIYSKMGLSGSGALRSLVLWASQHRELLETAAGVVFAAVMSYGLLNYGSSVPLEV